VPQFKLDGLTDPREAARLAHASNIPSDKPRLEDSVNERYPVNGDTTIPPEAVVKMVDKYLSRDVGDSNLTPEEEVEEEVVDLKVEKSALEKLSEMMVL